MDATTTMADAATCSSNWQDTLVERLQSLQSGFVDQGDEWLDYFAAVDLTSKTSTHDVTWTAEWNQFTTFGDWPQWDLYQQAILTAARDGWQGVQSVAYGVWITLQPFLYSAAYLVFRFLQVTVGAFLPYFQWMFVGICKFQLHATWQILAGEIAAVALTYIGWRFYKWCSTQQYTTRIRKAAAKNWNKAKQVRFSYLLYYRYKYQCMYCIILEYKARLVCAWLLEFYLLFHCGCAVPLCFESCRDSACASASEDGLAVRGPLIT